ncbi:hypothetical protein EYF80_012060 [Liparis tanakae]|uniref:Ig-like domain-containing protein n=1 Tax=Liparis tanakae TaxID=230148 RepID=A0A4Z2IKK6_9TELE|nr:hypothetical protein EYF80_012060 [Liparis tanakae]
MLTGWLTLTAFLAASAHPERAAIGRGALTVAPTRRVKGHPEAALTLNCGDGENAGVVQYWQTPLGDFQTPGSHRKPGLVSMQRDGSLTIPNTGLLHRGMYYCLLRHAEGTTLWPYELHVDREHTRGGALRSSRDVEPAGASGGRLAGAVAASVLLTFVVGFSAGALSRTPVLRCLGAVTTRLRSSSRQHCRTEVTMTTLPPMYDNQAFKVAHDDDGAADCATEETTTTPPPAKPQRSFRQKRPEAAQNTAAYLEGCDNIEEAGGSQKERNKGCDGEAEEEREVCGFYLEDGESQRETDEDKCSEDGESKEENEGWRQVEDRSKEDGGERGGNAQEKRKDQEEVKDGEESEEDDGETGSSKREEEGGDATLSPGRRSRVIRLYQYDEDGRRYDHLPDAAAEPNPAQRLKQRSLSLTRLSAIMAASAGPLDTRETDRAEERPHFHMEI